MVNTLEQETEQAMGLQPVPVKPNLAQQSADLLDKEIQEAKDSGISQDRFRPTVADVANTIVDFTPILGDIKGGVEGAEVIFDELKKDDPSFVFIGIVGGAAVLGLIPGVGDAAQKLIMKGAKYFKKDKLVPEVMEELSVDEKNLVEELTKNTKYTPTTEGELYADRIATMLREGRGSNITDDMLEEAGKYDDFHKSLTQEYIDGNVGMDLPMDWESTMARAADQGIIETRYHGSNYKGLPYFRGEGKRRGAGMFNSDNVFKAFTYEGQKGETYSLLMRPLPKDAPEVDVKGASWMNLDKPPPKYELDARGYKGKQIGPDPESGPVLQGSSIARKEQRLGEFLPEETGNLTTDSFMKKASQLGYPGATIKNVEDVGASTPAGLSRDEAATIRALSRKPSETQARTDTTGIRSVGARFDPRLTGLKNINMAQGGLTSIGEQMGGAFSNGALVDAKETLTADQRNTLYKSGQNPLTLLGMLSGIQPTFFNSEIANAYAYPNLEDTNALLRKKGNSKFKGRELTSKQKALASEKTESQWRQGIKDFLKKSTQGLPEEEIDTIVSELNPNLSQTFFAKGSADAREIRGHEAAHIALKKVILLKDRMEANEAGSFELEYGKSLSRQIEAITDRTASINNQENVTQMFDARRGATFTNPESGGPLFDGKPYYSSDGPYDDMNPNDLEGNTSMPYFNEAFTKFQQGEPIFRDEYEITAASADAAKSDNRAFYNKSSREPYTDATESKAEIQGYKRDQYDDTLNNLFDRHFDSVGMQGLLHAVSDLTAKELKVDPMKFRTQQGLKIQPLGVPNIIDDSGNEVASTEGFRSLRPVLRTFNEGGMAMNEQTQMAFALGGEAETVDPISGNDVPPGSLPVEVRDDIDAKLSEGEYVVPADVVRFFGVKYFEDLRMEAKNGLQQMDADGRIGGEPVADEPQMQMAEMGDQDIDALIDAEMNNMNQGGMIGQQNPSNSMYSDPNKVDDVIAKIGEAAAQNPEISRMLGERGIAVPTTGAMQTPEEMKDANTPEISEEPKIAANQGGLMGYAPGGSVSGYDPSAVPTIDIDFDQGFDSEAYLNTLMGEEGATGQLTSQLVIMPDGTEEELYWPTNIPLPEGYKSKVSMAIDTVGGLGSQRREADPVQNTDPGYDGSKSKVRVAPNVLDYDKLTLREMQVIGMDIERKKGFMAVMPLGNIANAFASANYKAGLVKKQREIDTFDEPRKTEAQSQLNNLKKGVHVDTGKPLVDISVSATGLFGPKKGSPASPVIKELREIQRRTKLAPNEQGSVALDRTKGVELGDIATTLKFVVQDAISTQIGATASLLGVDTGDILKLPLGLDGEAEGEAEGGDDGGEDKGKNVVTNAADDIVEKIDPLADVVDNSGRFDEPINKDIQLEVFDTPVAPVAPMRTSTPTRGQDYDGSKRDRFGEYTGVDSVDMSAAGKKARDDDLAENRGGLIGKRKKTSYANGGYVTSKKTNQRKNGLASRS